MLNLKIRKNYKWNFKKSQKEQRKSHKSIFNLSVVRFLEIFDSLHGRSQRNGEGLAALSPHEWILPPLHTFTDSWLTTSLSVMVLIHNRGNINVNTVETWVMICKNYKRKVQGTSKTAYKFIKIYINKVKNFSISYQIIYISQISTIYKVCLLF